MRRLAILIVFFLFIFCAEHPFYPAPVPDEPVTDIDGNVYQTVRIGDQVWMAENLRTTHYNDGTPVTLDTSIWTYPKTERYCYYENTTNPDSIKKFGALYTWQAVDTKKLAPSGWHVPSYDEWETLKNYLIIKGYNYDGTVSGNKIGKSLAAKEDWIASTNKGAIGNDLSKNNITGFSAYPGGIRCYDGYFEDIGERTCFWSSTDCDSVHPWHMYAYYTYLDYNNGYLFGSNFHRGCGLSVRCVQD